jgi:DNA sulfur modification protein DndD
MNEELDYGNEPYPLIIDAPYSVMDTDYIEKVSRILPKYAEQVIILVKDDNFNVAKKIFEEMNVIGKEYVIELEINKDGSENQFRTVIKSNNNSKVVVENV